MSEEGNFDRKSMTSSSKRPVNSKQQVLVNFYNQKQQESQAQQLQQQQSLKKQVRNIELVHKLSLEDPIIAHQQRHLQQIQKITQKPFNSQRNFVNTQQLSQGQLNQILPQQTSLSTNNASKQQNQTFQFFIPQKVDQFLINNEQISRNQSLPLVNRKKNQNTRQNLTSHNNKRAKNQSSHDILSNQCIPDEEEDRQNIITDNNYFISTQIQKQKINGNYNQSITLQNTAKSSVNITQNYSIMQESQSQQYTPLQTKVNQNNQIQPMTYALGNFSPTKEELTKRQLSQHQNGQNPLKQKMNIAQYLQQASLQQLLQSPIQQSMNQSSISAIRQTNNSTFQSSLVPKNELKCNNNQSQNLINNNTNNNNVKSDFKGLNQTNEATTASKRLTKIASGQKGKVPNIHEFIEREIFQKKQQTSASDKNNEKPIQLKSPLTTYLDEKLKQKVISNITPFNPPQQLNEQEQEEYNKLESGGFINYINTTFIDCEYMYRDEIQKQLIQLKNLFEADSYQNDSSNQTLDTPKQSQLQKQIPKTSDFREIKKQVEKLLCVEVAKKKERKTSELQFAITQMQQFQDILREGIKRCVEQLNSDCKNLILEIVSSLLLLQTKKHVLVEKKKRDDMILYLGGLKDKEKEFKVNIFGNESDVEAFRFKIGEVEQENQQIQQQMKLLKEKHNQLLQTHYKQKRASVLIKNEYVNLRNINSNLNERLSQKFESYEKRMSRVTLDPAMINQLNQSQPSSPAFILMEKSHNIQSQQQLLDNKGQHGENHQFLGIDQKLVSQKYETQSNNPNLIQLQIPSVKKQQEEEMKLSMISSQLDQKKLLDQSKQIDINDLDDEEEECDIEQLLRDVSKITKVDNLDVVIKEVKEKIPLLCYNQECQTDPKITNPKNTTQSQGIQTDLQLLDTQFDHIMDNERLKQVSKQEELKEQLMNLSEASDIDNINNISDINNKSQTLSEETSHSKQIFQRVKNRISIVRLIRGLPINKRKKPIKKKDIENFTENIQILKNFLDSDCSQSDGSIDELDESYQEEDEEEGVGSLQSSKLKNKVQDDTPVGSGVLSRQPKKNSTKSKHFNNSGIATPSNLTKDNTASNTPATRKLQQLNTQNSSLGKTPSNVKKRQSNFNQEAATSLFSKQQQQQQQLIEDDQSSINSPIGTNESNKIVSKKSRVKETNQILQDNKSDLKEQILQIIKLYNLETEKSQNYEESIKQLLDILQELFNFTYKIFNHVQKTQKDSYKSVVEQFFQIFTSLRWRLPKEIDQKFEEDLFPQEALKKKLQMKKTKQQASKSNAPRLQFNNNKMVQKLTMQDKSVHSGVVLTKKVREVGLPKRFNGYLPLKSILRQITQIYEDRIRQIRENRLANDTDMCIFVFNKFIHQYGFKNVAEQKYLHFLMNILNYQQIFRVNIFAKLIGVFQRDEDNYSIEEMDKYISCWNFLISGSTMGSAIAYNESDLKIYTHYLRALDLLKVKLEKILPPEYINELRAFIEQTKELEAKQTNKLVVDVDQLLVRVLAKYRLTMNSTKVYVKNAFLACDLDGNGSINLNEFLTLYRHIEGDKFSFTKAFKMFESNADIITEDEKCISFQKFTALCLQNHLFLDAAQRKFIGVRENYEIEIKFLDLKEDWQNEKMIITNYIESLKPFVQIETYEVWRDVLLVLQDRILKNQKVSREGSNVASVIQSENKITSKPGSLRRINSREDLNKENNQNDYQYNLLPILIAHKLLKQELKRLVEVGQNEELNEADLNSESNDDENNDYALGENNNNSNQEIQQSGDIKPVKKTNFDEDQDSLDSPDLAIKRRQQLNLAQQQNLNSQQTPQGAPKIEFVDAQIYQFSDIPIVRETPTNSSKRRQNTSQSNNSFYKNSTFSNQKQ